MLYEMMISVDNVKCPQREILADVSCGAVPETVGNYAELHGYTDANCYGGTEAIFETLHDAVPDTDEGHTLAWNNFCDLVNPATDSVDAWIRSCGIRAGLDGRVAK